jgi:hypothetical protein
MNMNKHKKMKITMPAAKRQPKSCPPGFGSRSSSINLIISLVSYGYCRGAEEQGSRGEAQ